MTFVESLILMAATVQIAAGCSCQMKCNPRGTAGCVSFENSEQNQCLGLGCPEVHVSTCTNPCQMSTQTFTVPKCCCCAPYCSIPTPSNCQCQSRPACCQSNYPCTSCSSNGCQGMRRFPSLPPPPMTGCYVPCPFPPSTAPPAAPSYCVQSVVVGGKPVTSDKNGEEEGQEVGGKQGGRRKGSDNPDEGQVGSGGGRGSGGGGRLNGRGGRLNGRGGGGQLSLDPIGLGLTDPGLNLRGGGLGLDGLLPGLRRHGGDNGESKRYEKYLDKILDVIKDKMEPECCGQSPMMVVSQPCVDCGCGCSSRLRVRKIRRRKQRKYMVESCEEPDVVVEEEEEGPYVVPCCRRSCCRPRLRSFRCCL